MTMDDEVRTLRQEIAALKARLFVIERKLSPRQPRAAVRKIEWPTPLLYAAGAMLLAVLLAQAMN